jgi:hypothetical protein
LINVLNYDSNFENFINNIDKNSFINKEIETQIVKCYKNGIIKNPTINQQKITTPRGMSDQTQVTELIARYEISRNNYRLMTWEVLWNKLEKNKK